ncbi:MAG: prepilin-type N-terminal cleavage/methylation domain-containing protein [Rubrivivax sp.]
MNAPGMQRAGRHHHGGLTLIELLVALALVAVLTTLALPSFATMMGRHRLKAVAENMALDLAELRFQATRRGVALHLQVSPGANWCYALALAPGCDCQVQQHCQIKTVHGRDHPGVVLEEGTNLLFEAQGTLTQPILPSQTGAVLKSSDGSRLQVGVSALGRPKVCAPGAAVAGYAAC